MSRDTDDERRAFIEKIRTCSDDDLMRYANDIITKQHASDFDPADAIADIEWQRKSFQQPESVSLSRGFVTWAAMDEIADELGEHSGKVHAELLRDLRSLRDEVTTLKSELHLVKALAKGEIAALIEDKRNVKTA